MNRVALVALAGAAFFGAASSALAADLIVDEPMAPEMVEPASGNWDGFYIGVFGGGAMGLADHDNDDVMYGPCSPDGCDLDLSGWLLGVDAGANFYLSDKIIGGVAADLAWSNVSGEDTFPYPIYASTNSIDWQGSIRGVLGFDGGSVMPYVTAGVAFAHGSHTSETDTYFYPATGEGEATHIGWTAGIGVAIAVADNMSVNLEYRHSDFGDQVYDENSAPYDPQFTLTQDAVTVGVHWAL